MSANFENGKVRRRNLDNCIGDIEFVAYVFCEMRLELDSKATYIYGNRGRESLNLLTRL
jgi:hypothetical protein